MSYKERIETISRPFQIKRVDHITGVVLVDSSGVDKISVKETRNGIEQPFHKQMIANRQGATSNMQATRETMTYSGSGITIQEFEQIGSNPDKYRHRYTQSDSRGGFTFNQVQPKSIGFATSKAQADALSKYYSKVNEIQRSVQGQVMAGEIRETIQLLRSPFKQGIALLTKLMRNSSTFRGPVRASGDLWLQYRFGILPLMQDIEGIKQLLNKQPQKEHVGSSRVYGSSQESQIEVFSSEPVYGAVLGGTITYEQKAEVIIRFGYLHQAMGASAAVTDDFMKSFLNPRDLPSTAWELIPFSFLVDYFINVGAILESITTYTGSVVWTSISTVKTSSATLAINTCTSYNQYLYRPVFSGGFCKRTLRTVDRTTAPPGIPPLTFSLPGSNIRLANIAALLSGLLKGK